MEGLHFSISPDGSEIPGGRVGCFDTPHKADVVTYAATLGLCAGRLVRKVLERYWFVKLLDFVEMKHKKNAFYVRL